MLTAPHRSFQNLWPLTYFFFHWIINTGVFPTEWNKARVSQLFKDGSRSGVDNYRPISVLPVLHQFHLYLSRALSAICLFDANTCLCAGDTTLTLRGAGTSDIEKRANEELARINSRNLPASVYPRRQALVDSPCLSRAFRVDVLALKVSENDIESVPSTKTLRVVVDQWKPSVG